MRLLLSLYLSVLILNYSNAQETNFLVNENTCSMAALEGLPSSVVNGCVCAITGLYIDHNVDFVLAGPEPLVFERTYSSAPLAGNLGIGWNANHRDWMRFERGQVEGKDDYWGCLLTEASGARFFFKRKYHDSDKKRDHVSLEFVEPKGLTNGSSGEISGRTNPKNKHLEWHPKDHKLVYYNGAKDYRNFHWDHKRKCYSVTSEKKVNGSAYRYKPDPTNFLNTKKIECYNSENQTSYSEVNIKTEVRDKKHADMLLETSDDRTIKYEYFEKTFDKTHKWFENGEWITAKFKVYHKYLSRVYNSFRPTQKYSYDYRKDNDGLLIAKKSLPNDRYQKVEYYKFKDNRFMVNGVECIVKDFCIDRVQRLYAPVGHTKDSIKTHEFVYQLHYKKDGYKELYKGKTYVFDAYKRRTTYDYDEDQRITCITKYQDILDPKTYSKEKFVWGRKKNAGNLIAKYLTDKKGNILFLRNYEYDKAGNVLENRLYGSLTGRKNVPIVLDSDHLPDSNCECEVIKSTYSQDGLNLKTSETDSNGVKTVFNYASDTDRLVSRFVKINEKIIAREFYEYDKNHAISKKITDDGSSSVKNNLQSVSEQLVTVYKNRMQKPIGLPEEETQYYLDLETGQLQQLKRIVSLYNNQGKLLKQSVFDAANKFRYTQKWNYDAHGNVIKEVNPLKMIITKEYDENDNLIIQNGPTPGYKIENSYDFMNRLIQQKETHPDGQEFSTSYCYDYIGNCITKFNGYGHETTFEYDDFNRLIATKHPYRQVENGKWVRPLEVINYNIAGHPIIVQDTAGRVTETEFNIRGQPLIINYPDGTYEKFVYRLDGKLEVKLSRERIKTRYRLDPLGRILEEETVTEDGQILKTLKNTYKNAHLIKATDAQGVETHSTYDGAGRLVWVFKGDQKSQTLYDTLSRPYEVREWYGSEPHEYRASIKEFDLLDRIVEERLEDHEGNVLHRNYYEYDYNGNRTVVQNGDQITRTVYNHHNNPIQITNAAGEVTHTDYNYAFLDGKNQKVLQTITTDPLGYKTIDTYNTANQLVLSQRRNPFGVLLSEQRIHYDITGNQCKTEDQLIEDDKVKKTIITIQEYGIDNQISALKEAFGTPEQKTTLYYYNNVGQLSRLVKPDGTVLLHEYDPLGRLKKLHTETIAYQYEYNLLDQVISVKDLLTDQVSERSYNLMGEMTQEKFATGLTIDYDYDLVGRTRHLTFPDQSQVEYIYNAVDLTEAHRIVDTQKIYTHVEAKRNLAGQIEITQMPGQNGENYYTYDSMGRCTSICSDAYKQEVPEKGYDAIGNLCSYTIQNQEYEFDYDDLNQISSEKGHVAHTYQYNSLSNRIRKNEEIHRYNVLNQLIKKGKETFKYDKNGNLIERQLNDKITKYQYDALDRLIAIQGEHEVIYQYDAFNRRISKKVDKVEQQLLYIGQEEIGVWQEELKEFRLLVKNETSSTAAIELDHKLYVPRHDLSGNIVCLTDEKGQVVERYRYTAFGESLIFNAQDEPIESSLVGNSWQYSSKRRDSESGLIAFGLRYYDVDLGRWMTPDPAGFECGPNLYAYIHNSPLVYKDRFGLFGEGFVSEAKSFFNDAQSFINDTYSFMIDPNPVFFMNLEEIISREIYDFIDDPSYNGTLEQSANYNLNDLLSSLGENSTIFPQTKNFVGFVNGVGNRFSDHCASSLHLGKLLGHNVVSTHSASFGEGYDGIRYALGRFGMATETVKRIHELWQDCFKKSPNGYIFWVCHSRGAVDTRNALLSFPKNLRERIVVVAVAPGGFIEDHLCKSVVHILSDKDVVPKLDRSGHIRCTDTVQSLKGVHRIDDHTFTNPMYCPEILNEYKNFMETYK